MSGVSSGAKITYGSYTGKGSYGKSNPTTIYCSFNPCMIILRQENAIMEINFSTKSESKFQINNQYNSGEWINYITWTSYKVSWYSTVSDSVQFNRSNVKYYYCIIGN